MVGKDDFSIPLVLVQQELAHLSTRYWILKSNQPPFDIESVRRPRKVDGTQQKIFGIEPPLKS